MSNGNRFFSSQRFLVMNVALVAMIIGFVLATAFNFSCTSSDSPTAAKTAHAQDAEPLLDQPGRSALEDIQSSFRAVAQNALPVVVEINVVEIVEQTLPRTLSPWDFFFGPSPDGETPEEREFRNQGLGSGVIVRRDGRKVYVLTNDHVVGSADEISITLYDGRQFEARRTGSDPRTDLALVMFETNEQIPVATLGDSDEIYVGDWAIAVGNPLGFESTVTVGIISAVGRRPDLESGISARYTDYIQTDAAINQGNSGGALLNIRGEVVGINSWIASATGGNIGLGFAIPVNIAKDAVNDFISEGRVVYGWLGVTPVTVTEESFPGMAEDLDVADESGSLVLNVVQGSPADKAGILPGDFITRTGDVPITDSDQFTYVVGRVKPGQTVDFTLIRYGKSMSVPVKITARESEEKIQAMDLWPGIYVQKIGPDIRESLSLPAAVKGFVVLDVAERSSASKAGFRQGDVISEINGTAVDGYTEFYRALNEAGSRRIEFEVWREGKEIMLGFSR